MKKFTIVAVAISLLALTACGSADEDKAPSTAPPEQAEEEAPIKVDMSIVKVAGRWKGQPSQDGRLIILDLASTGAVSMEVRRETDAGQEVLETATGQAKLSESNLSGTLGNATPAAGTLGKATSWVMVVNDKTGTLNLGDASYQMTWTGL